MTKTAFVQPLERPVHWTVTYGSVTFNQIGREFPEGCSESSNPPA
jgi:choloylglycine hydrolase